LNEIAQVGRQSGKEVAVCGESAGDIAFLPVLLGLGYRTLSVNVRAIPYVRQAVRKISMAQCERLARRALEASTLDEVKELTEHFHEG
jgi:phosphotransferase system enzyme I (PtsI)